MEAFVKAHHEQSADKFKALDKRIDNEVATRYWVREELHAAIKPITDSIAELAQKIGDVVKLANSSESRLEEFHATQSETMKQRTENEKRESEAKVASLEASSFANVIKRWWFWVLAILAFFPQLVSALEAVKKLLASL